VQYWKKHMAEVTVTKLMENQIYMFSVVVKDETSQTQHQVTLNKADYQRLTNGDVKPEHLIKKAFEYLLDQEPKEKILPKFDFTRIGLYFPNFHNDIKKRMEDRK